MYLQVALWQQLRKVKFGRCSITHHRALSLQPATDKKKIFVFPENVFLKWN
jgi:hypothetical protein